MVYLSLTQFSSFGRHAYSYLCSRVFNSGVEIHQDVIEHCRSALKEWTSSRDTTCACRSYPQIICGNGLFISATIGESVLGFDRIYIGAAIERSSLSQVAKLLSPRGVLVCPGKIFLLVSSRSDVVAGAVLFDSLELLSLT